MEEVTPLTDTQLLQLVRVREDVKHGVFSVRTLLSNMSNRLWVRRSEITRALVSLDAYVDPALEEWDSILTDEGVHVKDVRTFQGWKRTLGSDIWSYEDPWYRGSFWTLRPTARHGWLLRISDAYEECLNPQHDHPTVIPAHNALGAILEAQNAITYFKVCRELKASVKAPSRDSYEPPCIVWEDTGGQERDFQYQGILWTMRRSHPGFWLYSEALPEDPGRNTLYLGDNSLHARHKAHAVITEFYRNRDGH